MSEDIPSIAIGKMRSDLIPSVPSQLHCYGNNEAKMENLKSSMQMNDHIHFHSNAFYMGSKIFNNGSQLGNGSNTISTQSYSFIDYYNHHYPGSLQSNSNIKDISQQSLMLSKMPSISQHEEVRGNMRKRPYEFTEKNMLLLKEMKNTQKIPILESKWQQAVEDSNEIHANKVSNANKLHMPVRRRQKFSDKITSLQKLVSPHGKGCGEKQVDLKSKGLCLVPMSITQKVAMEDHAHHDTASRIVLPRNFNTI